MKFLPLAKVKYPFGTLRIGFAYDPIKFASQTLNYYLLFILYSLNLKKTGDPLVQ